MKKILTVSLFAMMAVSAANADIASTKYVTDRTGTVSFTADGFAKDASNLTEAINLIDSTLKSTSNTLTEDITRDINELKGDVAAIEGSAAMTSGITSDKVATYDGYSALITAAKKAGDDAQKTADGAVTVNGQQATAISANTTAINTLKGEANVEGSVKKSIADAITAANLSQYATTSAMNTELGKKQNNLSADQLTAVNSGITKAKVGTYDGYSALITTAQQQADKGVADAATAQAKADANETAIGVINNETTGILAQAKADAKTKADKALEDAKTYTDGQIDTLEVSLGTTAGDLSSLTTRVSTAEGNITSLQSDKADKTYVNTELGKKQNNLSADQLTAVNSGITSDKVATYDGYSDKISQNKSAITANTTSINTINNSAVMNSGVTDKVVKSVETHTNDINTIKASDVMKSGVTADVVAKAKSAMQEANLKALESWTTGQCAEPTVTCSLISKGGKIAWEVVTY